MSRNAEASAEFGLTKTAGENQSPNVADVRIGELGFASETLTSLAHHIRHIVGVGAEEEVLGIYARRRVATM